MAVSLFLNDPTDVNWKNTVPASKPFAREDGRATLSPAERCDDSVVYGHDDPGTYQGAYSFPDAKVLTSPRKPCPVRRP